MSANDSDDETNHFKTPVQWPSSAGDSTYDPASSPVHGFPAVGLEASGVGTVRGTRTAALPYGLASAVAIVEVLSFSAGAATSAQSSGLLPYPPSTAPLVPLPAAPLLPPAPVLPPNVRPAPVKDAGSREQAPTLPIVVKNTFVDVLVAEPLEDRFSRERRAHSCPAARTRELDPGELAPQGVEEQTPKPGALAARRKLPSLGSERHRTRKCKPCAFIYTERGCSNGFNCIFCHLCEPGEKKKRQKDKLERRRRQAAIRSS